MFDKTPSLTMGLICTKLLDFNSTIRTSYKLQLSPPLLMKKEKFFSVTNLSISSIDEEILFLEIRSYFSYGDKIVSPKSCIKLAALLIQYDYGDFNFQKHNQKNYFNMKRYLLPVWQFQNEEFYNDIIEEYKNLKKIPKEVIVKKFIQIFQKKKEIMEWYSIKDSLTTNYLILSITNYGVFIIDDQKRTWNNTIEWIKYSDIDNIYFSSNFIYLNFFKNYQLNKEKFQVNSLEVGKIIVEKIKIFIDNRS